MCEICEKEPIVAAITVEDNHYSVCEECFKSLEKGFSHE